jgi:ribosomal protein S18 acetylase RimI-like enzyme
MIAPVLTIRIASQHDTDTLFNLESRGFATDRFKRHRIEYLLGHARSTILIAECHGRMAGAIYLLWRRRGHSGRLYNVVVDSDFRGQGIGTALVREGELEAVRRGLKVISLEVRADNDTAIPFYEKHGYKIHETMPEYYEDGCTAYKMVKELDIESEDTVRFKVPYYAQTLEFTCGPACLIMALQYFDAIKHGHRELEFNIWKEATLIYMTSGIGGTGPFGLALAAIRRGLSARVLSATDKTPFSRSVRDEQKRDVIRLVHADMKETALKLGAGAATYDYNFDDIRCAMYRGLVPITLISTYRLTGDRIPHWVLITGFDRNHVYINDPDENSYADHALRARNLKIPIREFLRMSRYGRETYRYTVLIGPGQ